LEFRGISDQDLTSYINLYDKNISEGFKPYSTELFVMGALSLFVSWLFFNAGSAQTVTNKDANIYMATHCTVMAASSAVVTCLLLWPVFFHSKSNPTRQASVEVLVNAMMAGCVSITASCNNVNLASSLVIGMIGSILYLTGRKLFIRLEIDDPLDASLVHGLCGCWGVLAVGLFDQTNGLFFAGTWKQLLVQCLGAGSIIAWVAICTIMFVVVAKRGNRFRVGEIYEIIGMDLLDPHDADLLEKNSRKELGITLNDNTIAKIEHRQRNQKP